MMHVRITGAVQLTGEWHAFGEFHDLLASETNELSGMSGQNSQPASGDSNFTLFFPGRLGAGHFVLGRYVLGATPTTAPVAFVEFDRTFYAGLAGGILDVTSANYPPRPGLNPGLLSGTLNFKAVRLVGGPGGPVETADTITVETTFAAHWSHYLFPNVSVTLGPGGPVSGTSQFTTAVSLVDDHGGRFVEWESDFRPLHTFPHDISQELRVHAPAVGTYAVGALTPPQFADANQWPAVYTALFYRDDPRIGLSSGGTLTITQFLEPTQEYYGEMHGTLTSRVALWVDDVTVSADTVTESVTFAVQLWPLGGIPAVSRRKRD
jgi:hypothetical protein